MRKLKAGSIDAFDAVYKTRAIQAGNHNLRLRIQSISKSELPKPCMWKKRLLPRWTDMAKLFSYFNSTEIRAGIRAANYGNFFSQKAQISFRVLI